MLERFPVTQYINEDGELIKQEVQEELSLDLVKMFYEKMLRARMMDKKCVNLQRQGKIGTYVQYEGQEAAQVGSALAIEEGDWMFPSYRDHAATMTFGHSLRNLLLYWVGRIEGGIPPEGKNIFPPAVPIASQLLHATGVAWAEKKKNTDRVSLVYFGDGATSEGDFHEGLNFASVFKAPVVFLNQNNGYAISVPTEKQMNSKTIAQKGLGYDIPSIRIDGNDILAVFIETKKAVDRARRGEGPTLIEAVTWRYGAHTTADDPSKYRDQSESDRRRTTTDPLLRLEKYMKNENSWDEEWLASMEQKITNEINTAISEMKDYPKADIDQVFSHVFEKPTWTIEQQREHHMSIKRGKV
ncbi:pyruvate dehydrogenase (acetyl-transferring) E1 component subunit alpha [Halobacillus shinanisalinarum]|uniref:Pyruvate dehydrogenase E1 component subunit alpha n=1 Tax=Halobacillus shinanisalinarum TaxID=2932258 RepID=A0ABY4H607_9BACI|nr:pyruvate dehydrogenase (acetyl-transferring) E1 component subunit alpha [Halobacillus shinanisalinarum]UOQ95719.1 pyruvate dehydrogenase (acetyl-transferring) E1 component subunit alpha [Halobacillus shinanisalinarum]